MEFMNRSGQPRPHTTSTANAAAASKPQTSASAGTSAHTSAGAGSSDKAPLYDHRRNKVFRWTFIALLFSATALFVAMLVFLVFGVPSGREDRYIAKTEYQAVFVNVNGTNGGQVYFGHITSLTPQFIHLTNVFYIQNQATDQSSQANGSYNLVKLGCELHGPEDEMIINRSQVFFWENLKGSSQVAQKAAEFYKQNPSGQKCSSTTNSTQQSSGAAGTSTGSTTGGTSTPSTSTTNGTGTTTTPTATPPATTKKP